MNQSFDVVANLPAIIFALSFFASFVLCFWGGIILLTAKGTVDKLQKGRKILIRGFIVFSITALVVLVFYFVTYLLQRWYLSGARKGRGEFPASASIGFPPQPDYIEIENLYFRGPYSLKDVGYIENKSVFAILCPKAEGYDKIYIGEGSRINFDSARGRSCWIENCSKDLKISFLWTPVERYSLEEVKIIRDRLEQKVNPPCLLQK